MEEDLGVEGLDPIPYLNAGLRNQRDIIKLAPRHLRSAVLSAKGRGWSVNVEEHDIEQLPLSLANVPIIPSIGQRVSVFSMTPDPLPEVEQDDAETLKLAFAPTIPFSQFMSRYNFDAALFLLSGTVLLLYSEESHLTADSEHLPQTVGGFVVSAVVGKLESTSPDQEIGRQVHVAGHFLPSSFGVTVRHKSTNKLYNTYPSHMSHYIWRKINYWWWAMIKAWIGYGVGDWGVLVDKDARRYYPIITFDPKLMPNEPFPSRFTSDVTLASTTTPLTHPDISLEWPDDVKALPPAGLYQLLNENIDASRFTIEGIPRVWNRRIGVAIHRQHERIPTDHFAVSHLWRGIPAGAAEGDARKSLVGISGSPLTRRIDGRRLQIIGFQSYQILITTTNPSSDHTLSLFDDLCTMRTGFYGTFVLPQELVDNYTVI